MFTTWGRSRIVWLSLGLLVGLALGGVLPHAPLHAFATDRHENFAMCTGPVDEDTECLYILDFLTGDLKATVLSPVSWKFNAAFQTNILVDLQIDPNKNPRYLMVTGMASLRRNAGFANMQPSTAVVYVAEVVSGKVAAYAVPWNPGAKNNNITQANNLIALDVLQFRSAAIRDK